MITAEEQFNILIVDSDDSNQATLGEILQTEHHVEFAQSGEEAIAKAVERRPDLILLNLTLPDISGFDLLLKFKEMDEAREIPVILLTGIASITDEEKGLRLGAMDYLTRPFHSAVVQARVRIQLEIVKHIRTIERLGMIDALTDIPNRRFFDMRIKEEWRRTWRHRSSMSMLMVDVDQFKIYNDSYGHPQGDHLLKNIARILTENLHRPSDMAARLGGDEFAVLLGDTDTAGAIRVAESIRQSIEKGVVHTPQGESTTVTVSIGIGTANPTMDMEIADFIQQVDDHLYIAKDKGRNQVSFQA
ncbi:MAG: diguanylate cyclase [Treponema sp.]|jgi:diguanylate cyclase (GGDEF)-like protein|nr:diguanylate cyclase [Treponema sp.]